LFSARSIVARLSCVISISCFSVGLPIVARFLVVAARIAAQASFCLKNESFEAYLRGIAKSGKDWLSSRGIPFRAQNEAIWRLTVAQKEP
jgi:hypothetical protein